MIEKDDFVIGGSKGPNSLNKKEKGLQCSFNILDFCFYIPEEGIN
jgi:hypothetical protein